MPKHKADESRSEWMGRCVVHVKKKEGLSQKAAVGKCEGMYDSHMAKNKQYQQLIANVGGKTRTEYLEGEEYIVAPVAMMTVGVHNGSRGKLLYEEGELDRWSPAWDHKPIVINHPEKGPACTPKFLNTNKVGILLNTKFDRKKQRAEAWFNKRRTAQIEPRVIDVLNSGELMEVSTGLFVDLDGGPGLFRGQKYKAKAINHRPDHLAVLPDEVGACSVSKGAGLMQYNRQRPKKIRVKNRQDLLKAIKAVDSTKETEAAKGYIKKRARALGLTSLLPDGWTENSKEKSGRYVFNTKGKKMKKARYVDLLIENERTKFKDKDRKWLMSLNSEQLLKLDPGKAEAKEGEGEKKLFKTQEELDAAIAAGVKNALKDPKRRKELIKEIKNSRKKVKVKNENFDSDEDEEEDDDLDMERDHVRNKKNGKKVSLKAFLENDVPAELKPILNAALSTARREHERLVEIILNNENNKFKKEHLLKMDLGDLRGIAALAKGKQTSDEDDVSYFGAAVGDRINNRSMEDDKDVETLDLPVYNMDRLSRRTKVNGRRAAVPVGAGDDEDDIEIEEDE